MKRLWALLFGFDYFIAHRWADAHGFAKALCDELEKRDFDCFLDERNYETGGNLHLMQRLALGRTTRLIVIVSPLAHVSRPDEIDWLLEEVREFKRGRASLGREAVIAPIGTAVSLSPGAYPDSRLLAELPLPAGHSLYIEDAGSASNGHPQANTVTKLATDFTELRRRRFRLRVLMSIAMLMSVLAGVAVWQAVEAWRQSARRQALLVEASRREQLNGVALMESQRLRDAAVNLGHALRYDRGNHSAAALLQSTIAAMHRDPAPLAALQLGGPVRSAHASPDGNHMIACFENGTVVGLAVREGEFAEAFRFVSTYPPHATQWAPDSAVFAQAANIGVEIRDASTGVIVAAISPPQRSGMLPGLSTFAFRPDGQAIVIGWEDGAVETLEHSGGWLQRSKAASALAKPRVAWTQEGGVLVGGGSPTGGILRTLDSATLQPKGADVSLPARPEWLHCDGHGASAFVIDERGTPYLWRLSGESMGAKPLGFSASTGVSSDLELSPDGRFWAFSAYDRFFLIGTADGRAQVPDGQRVGGGIASLQFASDGLRLFVATQSGQGISFDIAVGGPDRICLTPESPMLAAFWSEGIARIVTVSRHGGMGFWDGGMQSAMPLSLSDAGKETDGVLAVRFDPAGALWSLRQSGVMERWRPGSWTREEVVRGDTRFASARFLIDGKHIGVVTAGQSLQVRESASLRLVSGTFPLAAAVADFDVSVSMDRVVVATRDRSVNAYKLDGTFLWGIPGALPGVQAQVTIIPERRWVLITANNLLNKPGSTYVLDLNSGKPGCGELIGEGQHESHAWLEDSSEIVTVEKGPLQSDWVRLWNPETALETGRFPVPASRGHTRYWPRLGVLQVPDSAGHLEFFSIRERAPIAFTGGTMLEANDLSADGRLLAAGRQDGSLEVREVDLAPSALPSAETLEAVVAAFSGSRLNDDGVSQIVPLSERAQLLQRARRDLAKEDAAPMRDLLMWKFQPGPTGSLSPSFARTRRQEADRLISRGSGESIRDAWNLDPTNPLVHLAMAAEVDPPLAAFYRDFALRHLPNDGTVRLRAAGMLLTQGQRSEAREQILKAAASTPTPSDEFRQVMKSLEQRLDQEEP